MTAGGAIEPNDAVHDRSAHKRWLFIVLATCILALGLRVGYVLGWKHVDEIGGDAYYYHRSAQLLAAGEGFVHPFAYDEGIHMPGADHPPAYTIVLAVPTLLGFDTILHHQLFTCLIGTGTVALLAFVGRRIAGPRAGLIAAGVGALYPNMWMNDAALMSESLAMLAGVAVILLAYRAWERPSWRWFGVVGAAIGVASLVRAEALLLVGLLALPLAIWAPGLSGWRQRSGRLIVTGAAVGLVIAPWVVPNLFRFEHPATLSTQLGVTLEAANCDETYAGPGIGSWSVTCATDYGPIDRSELDRRTRENALDYISENRGRLPAVLAARFTRTWGLSEVGSQLRFDQFDEARAIELSRIGLGSYYLLAAAGVAGTVILRRRGVPSFPITSSVAGVAITVLIFYGSTRFRAPAEPAIVLLAAVALDAGLRSVLSRRASERTSGAADVDAPASASLVAD